MDRRKLGSKPLILTVVLGLIELIYSYFKNAAEGKYPKIIVPPIFCVSNNFIDPCLQEIPHHSSVCRCDLADVNCIF